MPPQRNRYSNPQGRQKSCSECAKAKRRCDLQQPFCIRCTRQKLTCVYPSRPNASQSTTPESPIEAGVADQSNQDTLPPFIFDIGLPEITSAEVELLNFEFPSATTSNSGCDEQNLDGGLIIDLPPSDATCISAKPSSIFGMATLSPLAETRVGYPFEQMKLAPRMLVETNSTPWSHRMLYEDYMPNSLQDAYGSCALYIARNETNATFVARHVMERLQVLWEAPLPIPPIEALARVQAFMLYLIILISAGDIRYFGHAEKITSHLQDSLVPLFAVLSHEEDPLGSIPIYPSSTARSAWQSYIFRESCRRTLLIAFQAIATYNLLHGKLYSCSHELAVGNRMVVSAALWDAKSPFDFAKAWNEKNHFLVKNLKFDEVLEEATAQDVDVFGRMMMVGILGVDDVRGWIHTRGGEL